MAEPGGRARRPAFLLLLILLTAMAVLLAHTGAAGPDVPSSAASGGT